MRLAACFLLLALLVSSLSAWGASAPFFYRDRMYKATDRETGERVMLYVRVTCKKAEDGKPGVVGSYQITVLGLGGLVRTASGGFDYCPTTVQAVASANLYVDSVRPASLSPKTGFRLAASDLQVPTPASGRLYLADSTGPAGLPVIAVMPAPSYPVLATIDVDDRLFAGLQLAPDGRRLYALLWPKTLGTPAPAYVAYVDPATNTIVDRLELPGLLEPQVPALSPNGRYVYFSARTAEGPFRIRVADLQQKTVESLADPVPANTDLRAVALSPDGALLCASGLGALTCYETRTRAFLARISASPPNRELPPVFHPNGSRIYVLNRAFVSGVLTVYIAVVDTGTLTETTRIPIMNPAANDFRESLARLTIDPSGLSLILDEGFNGTLNVIDTRTDRVLNTIQGLATGAIGGAVVLQ